MRAVALLLAAAAVATAEASRIPMLHRRQANVPTCPTTPATTIANNLGWQLCPNTDFNLRSLSYPITDTAAACAQLCATTNDCTTAVWDQVDHTCHIKGNPGNTNFNPDSKRYLTIKQAYTPQDQAAINGNCPFGQYTYTASGGRAFAVCPLSDYQMPSQSINKGVKSVEACADMCAQTSGCAKGVFDHQYQECHIKGDPAAGSYAWKVSTRYDVFTVAAPAQMTPVSACPSQVVYAAADGRGWEICPNSQYNVGSQQWPNVASNTACAALCAKTNGCSYAVYDHNNGACHIKGSPGQPNWVADNRFDAVKLAYTPNQLGFQFPSYACPWGASKYSSGGADWTICPLSDFSGPSNSVTNNINSAQACADLCAKQNGCVRAVWDSINNACHNKAGIEGLAQIVDKQYQTIVRSSDLGAKTNGKANTAAIVGMCGVSAQHMFLGDDDTVYIVDKTEASPLPTPDRANAASAASFSLSTGMCRPMYTASNQFCAAGGTLGDGRWVSGGGNPAQNGQGQGNGLRAIRTLTPCNTNSTCQWSENNGQLGVARWYPSGETSGDGSMIWLGGYNAQVFLPIPQSGNTPTAEYFPSKGGLLNVPVLNKAWPFSLYPLTHHLSDGRIFMVAGSNTVIWNPANQQEQTLPTMPNGPRTYPSGGSAVLLPLTPANNYAETSLLCGGNSAIKDWGNAGCPAGGSYNVQANSKCDQITPLANNAAWTSAPDMPAPRLMGNFILLPDNKIALVNGAQAGTQGFGCDGPGGSLATRPSNTAYVYDPQARSWATLATQQSNRGYHASATLLPDGSVLVGGSSPHNNVEPWTGPFPTEFRLEKIYPSYYDAPRPSNAGVPTSFGYGGGSFTIGFGSANEAQNAYVRLIRTGWSTHGLQMQQRSYELTRTVNGNSVTFNGLPGNAKNIFPPGAALAFLVVNGVPATGKSAIVGPGRL